MKRAEVCYNDDNPGVTVGNSTLRKIKISLPPLPKCEVTTTREVWTVGRQESDQFLVKVDMVTQGRLEVLATGEYRCTVMQTEQTTPDVLKQIEKWRDKYRWVDVGGQTYRSLPNLVHKTRPNRLILIRSWRYELVTC